MKKMKYDENHTAYKWADTVRRWLNAEFDGIALKIPGVNYEMSVIMVQCIKIWENTLCTNNNLSNLNRFVVEDIFMRYTM